MKIVLWCDLFNVTEERRKKMRNFQIKNRLVSVTKINSSEKRESIRFKSNRNCVGNNIHVINFQSKNEAIFQFSTLELSIITQNSVGI